MSSDWFESSFCSAGAPDVVVHLDHGEWRAFVDGVKAGEFDHLGQETGGGR